jgi:hypothetical protein
MDLYLYRPDANRFAGVGFSKADDGQIVDVHYTDTPLTNKWIVPVAHGFEDNPPTQGDFASLSNFWRIPVMSQRAWDALLPLIGESCEALPIVHPTGDPYFIIHVMETVDCLDTSNAQVTRNAVTGRVSRIFRYAFNHNFPAGKHIFKLPIESGAELIVDDDFRRAVESSGLMGLKFEPLPL